MKSVKWVVSVLVLVFVLGSAVGSAMGVVSATRISISGRQTGKVKIKKEDLPSAVTEKLEDSYEGWTIVQAYKTNSADNPTKDVYEVELKKGTQTQTVKFDKDGNVIL